MTEDGIPGDLICTRPFPSMPVGFWGDTPDKTAYKAAYFSKFEGVWAHGDFLLINQKTKGNSGMKLFLTNKIRLDKVDLIVLCVHYITLL